MNIQHIVVVGAGTMGNGIAQTAAVSGYRVTMTDIAQEYLDRAKASIARSVDRLAGKGTISAAQKEAALGIATALSPQIDLATEPRWSRVNGTFGESPRLSTDMARAYVDGFQTSAGDKEILMQSRKRLAAIIRTG